MLKVKSVQQVGFRKNFPPRSYLFCIDFLALIEIEDFNIVTSEKKSLISDLLSTKKERKRSITSFSTLRWDQIQISEASIYRITMRVELI